jgi:UDP-glucose 4-epimerase
VTGAAGFIGGHLLERLIELGWDVAGVDDMSAGHPELLPDRVAKLIGTADFADERILDCVGDVDVIFHMAAVPRVSYSVEHPLETHVTNYDKTVRMLDAVRRAASRPRIVLASSSSVYGDGVPLPTRERDAQLFNQLSPYAMQKVQCEMALRMYWQLYGVDSVALRFFNVFGPRQLGSSPYAQAIAAWLTAYHEGVALRSDGDGEQQRDMCFVSNVVDACVAAATAPGKLAAQPLNVGCGERVSNNEILAFMRSKLDNVRVEQAPARPGDVRITHADVSAAATRIGYVPSVSIWDGIGMTMEWYAARYAARSAR